MKKIVFLSVFIFSSLINAQSRISYELLGGLPCNVSLPLIIEQNGYPTISLHARYTSYPFVSPFYYVIRIGLWKNQKAWEFAFVHHKLYLHNKPAEVERFSISHGYNLILISRAIMRRNCKLSYGGGVVLAHAENTVRGKPLEEDGGLLHSGYYICGVALNLSIGKRYLISKRLFLTGEFQINPSVARVPIDDGYANMYNLTFQFIFGLGCC